MGASLSCGSSGGALMVMTANGDLSGAQEASRTRFRRSSRCHSTRYVLLSRASLARCISCNAAAQKASASGALPQL